MNGLLYKDLALLRNMGKAYLFMIVLFGGLTLVGIYDIAFLFMMIAVLLCMFPSTSFSYDELAKWDRFAIATPGGRAAVVQAKYAFSLILAGGTLGLNLVLLLIVSITGRLEYGLFDGLFLALAGVAVALLLNAILLPLLFRFGAQKARVAMIACIALGSGAAAAGATILNLSYNGSILQSPLLPLAVPVVVLAALAISYRISLKMYAKKDFQ